jgi:hypothetical protein
MREHLLVLLAGVLFLAPAPPALAQDPLAAAKDFYASAEYESALAALDEARRAPDLEPPTILAIEQYRALCLLAVGRKADAEKAIEAVLDLDPFYLPGEDDAAPWVRTAFREVRQRVLPGTLQQLYGRGKRAFDRKDYAAGEADFLQVMRVLEDPDLPLDAGAKADMRLVVQGFLDLAKVAKTLPAPPPAAEAARAATPGGQKTAAAQNAPTGTTAAQKPDATSGAGTDRPAGPPAPVPPVPSPAPVGAGLVYDSTATDVTPPLPLRQPVTIPATLRPPEAKEGVVEIVIAANGGIESATVRQSFGPTLDPVVLQAVRAWRYRPGLRAGSPVRYRRLVRIVLPGQ